VTFVFVIARARKHCEIVKIPNQLAVCRPKKRGRQLRPPSTQEARQKGQSSLVEEKTHFRGPTGSSVPSICLMHTLPYLGEIRLAPLIDSRASPIDDEWGGRTEIIFNYRLN
jgi:hypothetical protein